MEGKGNGKIIAIVALVVAVVGLSLGFAAYTTYLRIEGTANVDTSTLANWNVGFSSDGNNIEALNGTNTVNGVNVTTGHTTDGGAITVKKYSVTQASPATLAPVSGSSVSYTFHVLNKGSVDATLGDVTFNQYPVTCAYVPATGNASTDEQWVPNEYENNTTEPYAGTKRSTTGTGTISPEDCNAMFDVTLSLNGTDYSASTTGSGTLAKASGDHTAILTIAYNATNGATAAAKLDGDVVVTINPIGVVYTSSH